MVYTSIDKLLTIYPQSVDKTYVRHFLSQRVNTGHYIIHKISTERWELSLQTHKKLKRSPRLSFLC